MEHPSVLGRISNKGIFTSDSTDFRSSSNDANETNWKIREIR